MEGDEEEGKGERSGEGERKRDSRVMQDDKRKRIQAKIAEVDKEQAHVDRLIKLAAPALKPVAAPKKPAAKPAEKPAAQPSGKTDAAPGEKEKPKKTSVSSILGALPLSK